MRVQDNPTTLTIERVVASWNARQIQPNREYQRGSAWKLRQKQLLIDSIFRGYPLPRFYFERKERQDIEGNVNVTLDVIDGQQRLIALAEYIEDRWPLFDPKDSKVALPNSIRETKAPWLNRNFSSLGEDLQAEFLATTLSVVYISATSNDELRDLFIRLQSGTPLTAQQVRDAWPGNVGPYIERLAGKGNRQGTFDAAFQAIDRRGGGAKAEDENADEALDGRQTCAQLLLLLLSMDRGRGYPRLTGSALNDLYHENTELDTTGPLCAQFEEILSQLQRILVDLRPDAPAGVRKRKRVTKGQVFSLVLFLRVLAYSPVDIKRTLPGLAEAFWAAGGAGEGEPVGRVGSPAAIENHFSWFLGRMTEMLSIAELDNRRLFSAEQKQDIWNNHGGICGECKNPVEFDYAEFDHVQPWILGGRTEVGNGRPVHPPCHKRGLAAVASVKAPPIGDL